MSPFSFTWLSSGSSASARLRSAECSRLASAEAYGRRVGAVVFPRACSTPWTRSHPGLLSDASRSDSREWNGDRRDPGGPARVARRCSRPRQHPDRRRGLHGPPPPRSARRRRRKTTATRTDPCACPQAFDVSCPADGRPDAAAPPTWPHRASCPPGTSRTGGQSRQPPMASPNESCAPPSCCVSAAVRPYASLRGSDEDERPRARRGYDVGVTHGLPVPGSSCVSLATGVR